MNLSFWETVWSLGLLPFVKTCNLWQLLKFLMFASIQNSYSKLTEKGLCCTISSYLQSCFIIILPDFDEHNAFNLCSLSLLINTKSLWVFLSIAELYQGRQHLPRRQYLWCTLNRDKRAKSQVLMPPMQSYATKSSSSAGQEEVLWKLVYLLKWI